jgi:hypothetical protein
MLRHNGGARVKCGYYWNPARWEIVTIPRGGGLLPGGGEQLYLRLPIFLLLLVAPVMGGLYVLFLPFIGFFMILRLAARQGARALQRGFMEVAAALSHSWRPGEAYFAGKRTARKEKGQAPTKPDEQEDRLAGIEEEIERRRTAKHE